MRCASRLSPRRGASCAPNCSRTSRSATRRSCGREGRTMATLTPLQKRAERKSRNQTGLDMNLVSLIDVFTILIFFLLSSASGVELLASPKAVKLPISTAEKAPVENIVVAISETDILVDGRVVMPIGQAMAQ